MYVYLKDFLARLESYAKVYEQLDEAFDLPYIQVIDVGRRLVANRISGYLPSKYYPSIPLPLPPYHFDGIHFFSVVHSLS